MPLLTGTTSPTRVTYLLILAKDLVRRMLTPDPHKRITADEILKHPWLLENADVKLKISDKLKSYNAKRRLKVEFYLYRKQDSLPLLQEPSKIRRNKLTTYIFVVLVELPENRKTMPFLLLLISSS